MREAARSRRFRWLANLGVLAAAAVVFPRAAQADWIDPQQRERQVQESLNAAEHHLSKIEDRLQDALAKKQKDDQDRAWHKGLITTAAEEIGLLMPKLAKAVNPAEKAKLNRALKERRDRIAKIEKDEAVRENGRKDRARSFVSIAGEYVQAVADLRSAVNEAEPKDRPLEEDPRFKGMRIEKVPPAILTHLQTAEAAVKTEEIALEPDKIVSWVPAILDGRPHKMIVDPDVDVIRISEEFAAAVDVTPADTDPTVEVSVDGGPMLKARRTMLKRVQVGSFTVEGVECLVILDGYRAPPLLGAGFLDHFAFRFDPEAGKLTLSSVTLRKPETLQPARDLIR